MCATAVSSDPPITAVNETVNPGESSDDRDGAQPPNLPGQEENGVGPTEIAPGRGEHAHFGGGFVEAEMKVARDPRCLERKKTEPAAAENSSELARGGDAIGALAVIEDPSFGGHYLPGLFFFRFSYFC
jgi:hypothetical protein